MSSAASSSADPHPAPRSSKRGKTRNGTFIIPRTGERSRRQFTLRTAAFGHSSNARPGSSRSFGDAYAETAAERARHVATRVKVYAQRFWHWLQGDEGHAVLKCTLAYLLGSLATFWSPLSKFLGNRDGKHVVATITVYFHPARSAGEMLEAVLIAFLAVAYAEVICLLAMAVSIVSRNHFGNVQPAHAIILIVFIGGGLGLVGWVKQRLNQPLVNVATTLTSIAIISVLTKEQSIQIGYFSEDKVVQMLKMLLMAITCTVAVNLAIWRVSARQVLRTSIFTASVSLSGRLSYISRAFLNGTDEELQSPEYAAVNTDFEAAYALMTKTSREAKFEYYFLGQEKIYRLDKRLVRSVEALAQGIGGLRSALDTQLLLLAEPPSEPDTTAPKSPRTTRSASGFAEITEQLSVIDESNEVDVAYLEAHDESNPLEHRAPVFRAPADIFSLFIALLGPSMKALAYTLSEALRDVRFGKGSPLDAEVHVQLRESLQEALKLYDHARANALTELYRGIQLGRFRSEKVQADIEEVAAACGHFSFGLQAVADEMDNYFDILLELQDAEAAAQRTWNWLKIWHHIPNFVSLVKEREVADPEGEALLQQPLAYGIGRTALPKGIPDTMLKRKDTFNWDAAPQSNSIIRQLSQGLLKVGRFVSREDVLFGIKVGIGAILWAMFAFIPPTRPIYQEWRGEWGLLSYMIVAGMTTGAANTTGTARFYGTLMGAACACVSWLLGGGNAIVLAILGWMVSFATFYVILAKGQAPLGRISLLAYNVIVLYAYSISQAVDDDDDDEGGTHPIIFTIAYHRIVAVTLGILWGVIFCRLLWPISARTKFREGLSVLYLQMALVWKRGPLRVLLDSEDPTDYMREGERAAMQRYAFKLDTLRKAASSEFELRGPFPAEAYGRIMRSTRRVLNAMYAMRLVTQRRHHLSDGERAILELTTGERLELCQRVCHILQVLASSLMLEYPLTDAIPSIDNTKDRLLNKVYQFHKNQMQNLLQTSDTSGDDADGNNNNIMAAVTEEKDFALLYAYTLVTAQVAEDLKKVRMEIEGLFGMISDEALLLE